MGKIIRVINQNSLHQNRNREEVENRDIRYLPDLTIFNLLLCCFCFGRKNFELIPYLSNSSFIFWGSRITLLVWNWMVYFRLLPDRSEDVEPQVWTFSICLLLWIFIMLIRNVSIPRN